MQSGENVGNRIFVDLPIVTARQKVIDSGEPAHFGSVMELCHKKHAELTRSEAEEEYKARVVFRGGPSQG